MQIIPRITLLIPPSYTGFHLIYGVKVNLFEVNVSVFPDFEDIICV